MFLRKIEKRKVSGLKKIAIVTDSNSGITQERAKELGIYVIPMPFQMNDHTYLEGITLSQEEFYDRLVDGTDISTSQPSIEDVMSMWDNLLKEYDEIVHIPMSSGLSGSMETAKAFSREYDNKVFVVDNKRISVTQYQSVLDSLVLREQGKTGQEICEILEKDSLEASIYVMVDTLKYLKKGGRITPAAAALGTLLRLKPVLQIQGAKLDAFAKARTVKQAKGIMIQAIKQDIEGRFASYMEQNQLSFAIAYTNNYEEALEFKKEVLEQFGDMEVTMGQLSLSVACHIGPGALALAVSKKEV